jgi:hypothetical protein
MLSDICKSNLRQANLSWADLRLADLREANLHKATMIDTIFIDTTLSGADFDKVVMSDCYFGNIDFSKVRGVETIKHEGPSTIGIDTIYKSNGKIPERFLRGAGIPDNFIEYMHSLTGTAFDYYSCFISYSSKDQNFADCLYTDLQNKGVRCWYAPEDMKVGDKIRQRIDQSIRVHDKLLLILSENSINSEWVEDECEAAYEEERKREKTVLFPVRIDDAVMDTDQAWAAKLRRSRHIGDFRDWKDHGQYQKAFERLLRDLKAAE